MYQPPHFREDRIEVQHALIRAQSLGLLITAGPGGLQANHVPFLIDAGRSERGTLRVHLARANPQRHELAAVAECLVVFQGPQQYISPSLYPTKQEHGKVVPTWNYVTVHAWGRPRVIDDAAWLTTASRGPDGAERRFSPCAVAGFGRARAVRRRPVKGHRRHRNPDRAHRRQMESQPEPAGDRPGRRGCRPARQRR